MRLPNLAALALLSLLSCAARPSAAFAVVGYLPEWRYEGANWDTLTTHLTHLILFSAEPSADGGITGLDRLPRTELLQEAKSAAQKNGADLLVCFGGNGRSAGFSPMVRNAGARKRFVKAVVALLDKLGAQGVDYNWEYPARTRAHPRLPQGYSFGTGYHAKEETAKDYEGLAALVKETRAALGPGRPITLAYYPDGRQEEYLSNLGISADVDLMHMMTYDANDPKGHSSMELASGSMKQGVLKGLPAGKLTLGLPFYGRNSRTGDWTTYEDIVQKHHPLSAKADSVRLPDGTSVGFNGRATIAAKTRAALGERLGGVMIWEAGQDCRQVAVVHGKDTHSVTCPEGAESSLLVTITREMEAAGAGKKAQGGNVPVVAGSGAAGGGEAMETTAGGEL